MRRTVLLVLVMALIARYPRPEPPAGAIKNVEFVANLPEPTESTAINFMRYGAGM